MNDKVHGIVLSGGEGKRLRPLTYYFQKCMIPIGSRQKPLLEYIVRILAYYDVKDLTILVGYKREQIINYFNGGERFGVRINYVNDNPDLKGSGGALVNAYKQGIIKDNETLLIYYGDILSNLNLTEMLGQHMDEKAVATLAIASGYQVPVGVAETSGKKIIGWHEKPTIPLNVGIGMLALESTVLKDLANLSEIKEQCDIMGDFVPHLIETGICVGCYSTNAFWYDVGTTERYEKLDNGLIEEVICNLLFEKESLTRT
jgi:mannose-1-phosphate guanylyltransferase